MSIGNVTSYVEGSLSGSAGIIVTPKKKYMNFKNTIAERKQSKEYGIRTHKIYKKIKLDDSRDNVIKAGSPINISLK